MYFSNFSSHLSVTRNKLRRTQLWPSFPNGLHHSLRLTISITLQIYLFQPQCIHLYYARNHSTLTMKVATTAESCKTMFMQVLTRPFPSPRAIPCVQQHSTPRIKAVHRLTKNSISSERSECTRFPLQIIKGERFPRNLTLISMIYSVKNAKKLQLFIKNILQTIIV